jgi:hypothetical protein
MSGIVWVLVAAAGALGILVAFALLWARRLGGERGPSLERARAEFHRRREWLEARFVTRAGESGKPRGLVWADCEFDNDVAFARERTTGELRALVGVTIRFEAIAGGDMEDVPAVNNLKFATAVFRAVGDAWETDGRAVFNLNPAETIQHFQHELEVVE